MSKTVKVGLIGAGFVTDLHAFSFQKYVPAAEIVAVASPTPGKAAHFAKERGIPNAFDDYRELLALKEIDVITVAIPNDLHAQVAVDAARRGQARGLREAAVPHAGRGRSDDRRLPEGRACC